MKWRTLSSDIAYDGSPFFILRKETVENRKGEQIYPWYKMQRSNFVVIVPLTPEGNLIMIEQYRHGIEEVSLELPSGSLEFGESPSEAASRELLEETGYKGDSLVQLGEAIAENVAMTTSMFDVFMSTNARRIATQTLDETEDIKVVEKPFNEATQACFDGKIVSSPSLIAILRASIYLRKPA